MIIQVMDSARKSIEQGCYDAIDAVYEELYLRHGRDPSRIIAWGRSLGTGPSSILLPNIKWEDLSLKLHFFRLLDL